MWLCCRQYRSLEEDSGHDAEGGDGGGGGGGSGGGSGAAPGDSVLELTAVDPLPPAGSGGAGSSSSSAAASAGRSVGGLMAGGGGGTTMPSLPASKMGITTPQKLQRST